MRFCHQKKQLTVRAAAALAAAIACAAPAVAGTTSGADGNPITISISGSTALKNFVTSQGFTYLTPGTSITLSTNTGGTVAINPDWFNGTSGTVTQFELAPSTYSTGDVSTGANQSYDALRVEYHESGSVEGILEMANDQIGNLAYVENNINRDPNAGNGVWVNGNLIGDGNGLGVGSSPGGYYLGPMYGSTGPGSSFTSYGSGVEPTFNSNGSNISSVAGSSYTQAGQNAVQLAVSDVIPVQAFQNDYGSSSAHALTPWLSTPSDLGYGQGNTKLHAGGLGIAGGQVNLQSSSVLNMPAGATSPTGTTFGTGAWNTAGLGNLSSSAIAVSATLFVANPGTGLDRLNRTDAQWLQTTGRLANGAAFEMTTRDVNSGTHNVAALNTGLDPSWAVGIDDNGNGNSTSGSTSQISIGSGLRFSNKTAGGAELRPTVQNARMAVGTLSVGDANGTFQTNEAFPTRALEYSDSTDGSNDYVLASANNIVTGNYVIYQNEQFVTLKAPSAAYATDTATQWADLTTGTGPGQVAVLGDDATQDVSQIQSNVTNAVNQLADSPSTINSLSTSAFSLLNKGFILTQFMQVEKPMDGIGLSTANPIYNSTTSQDFLNSYSGFTTASDPDSLTNGKGSDTYDGKGTNTGSINGQITITTNNNSNGTNDGGNWLFGNFNQNGIRDFDSVVVQGLAACTALEASGAGNSMFSGSSDGTVITGLQTALANMTNYNGGTGATKGDLIVMGDFDGRGTFDGLSLYELAVGASVADATAAPNPNVLGAGGNDRLTLQAENLTVMNSDGSTTNITQETFGDAVRRGKLFKNEALDYLNNFATAQEKQEGRAVLEGSSAPSGSTIVGTDTVSGLLEYTYDPTGANAYNKSDVNRDGVVDLNDGIIVDNANGLDYTNQANQLTATYQAPVTGASNMLNLVLAAQTDSTIIGSADVAVVNTQLTGTANSNLYGYTIQKAGPSTITFARTGGTNTVYAGAGIEVSGGVLQVGGSVDPFSDNNTTGPTVGNHAALMIDSGGKVALLPGSKGITVSSLSIATTGTSQLDLSTSKVVIDYASAAAQAATDLSVTSYLSGASYNEVVQTGTSIISSSLAANTSYAIGEVDGNDSVSGSPVAANSLELAYTLKGDLNLDGVVNGTDFSILVTHFGQPLSGIGWEQGDINGDGIVNGSDFSSLVTNFGAPNNSSAFGDSTGGGLVTVPEPASAGLLLVGGLGLVARRKRTRN